MSDLEQRVQKLERQNRKLQVGLVAVVALLLVVPLVGAVMPQGIPDIIEARQFRVLDADGKVAVDLGNTGLWLNNTFLDVPGAHLNAGGLTFQQMGRERPDGSVMGDDEVLKPVRILIGSVHLDQPVGEGMTEYLNTVVLFDSEGNVIWQAPR